MGLNSYLVTFNLFTEKLSWLGGDHTMKPAFLHCKMLYLCTFKQLQFLNFKNTIKYKTLKYSSQCYGWRSSWVVGWPDFAENPSNSSAWLKQRVRKGKKTCKWKTGNIFLRQHIAVICCEYMFHTSQILTYICPPHTAHCKMSLQK
jgi:hypothetical protein